MYESELITVIVSITVRNRMRTGGWDGSTSKGACCQAWCPECHHIVEERTEPLSCLLTSTCTPWHMCVSMHAHKHVHTHTGMREYACLQACTHTHEGMCEYVCSHACTHMGMCEEYACSYACTHEGMHEYACSHTYTHTHEGICEYACAHACTHTYTRGGGWR